MPYTKNEQIRIRAFWKKHPKLITKEIRDIIHGYMLGDGTMTVRGGVQVMQCLAQLKWVQWMYDRLRVLRSETPINANQKIVDPRTKKTTYSCRFTTLPGFTKGFRHMWYKPDPTQNGKCLKSLPKSIKAIMNPTVLTLWYAGDGTKIIGSKGAKIEVTGFTIQERIDLKSTLEQKLGLEVKLNKAGTAGSGKEQYTLNFNADTYQEFRECTNKYDLIQTLFPDKLHPM